MRSVHSQKQSATFGAVEFERRIHEGQLCLHRQFTARPRIPSAPDQLLPSKFLMDDFEERRSYTTVVPAQKIKAAFQEPMLLLPARTLPEGPNWAYGAEAGRLPTQLL